MEKKKKERLSMHGIRISQVKSKVEALPTSFHFSRENAGGKVASSPAFSVSLTCFGDIDPFRNSRADW